MSFQSNCEGIGGKTMAKLKITIDGKETYVEQGATILDAAKQVGVEIPTLCHLSMHSTEVTNKCASCRICVVEVAGRRNLAPSCATPVTDGMVVTTCSPKVLHARKMVLELMLSDHPSDCLVCEQSGDCELQDLAVKFGMREINIGKDGEKSVYKKDFGPSIVRDMDKCIMCRRCETVCNKVQTVGALSGVNRGFEAVVAPAFEESLKGSVCTQCGQCVAVCPTGALTLNNQVWDVIKALSDKDQVVVVQTAPAVRVALGELFGLEPGTNVTGKMVAALKQLGFDYVFDTDFAADVTIMEEATELLDRLVRVGKGDTSVKLPMLTSCCPAWINFVETQFPHLLDLPSSVKSPQQIFGALAKSYFAELQGIPKEKMKVVSIMPCLAKKSEVTREEFNKEVDLSISTKELAKLIKQANIDFDTLKEEEFDEPMGESTGAGVIFGTTGGVIEAAVRTAYEKVTGETLEKLEFEDLRGMDGVRCAHIQVGDTVLNIGVAHGLGNARRLLEEVEAGNPRGFHAIEVMACPAGCIGGAGQPSCKGDETIIAKRREGLYAEDKGKVLRKSHENPAVKKLYDTYLGYPMSHKAHDLLHTHYTDRERI